MGTQHCDLSEKTTQVGSECLDNEQRVLGTVVTDSVIDEKKAQISSECLDNEQGVLGTVVTNSVIDEKTVQIVSECLDNEQSVLGTVATDSVIDEKSNKILANMTENSVIQLPKPSEHVPVCLSDDKSENKCVQNVQNKPGETSDAVASVVVEEQTQPVPAQVNLDSANKPSDPPSGDGVKDISLPNEPGEMSDAVTSLVVEEQTQAVPAQVNSDSAHKPSDPPSGDGVKVISLPNEPGETSDAVTSLVVEEQTQTVPAQVNSDSANKPSDPPSGDGVKVISLPNEPGETSDAVTSLVEEQTQPIPAQVNLDSANKPSDPPSGGGLKDISLPNEPGETSDAVTSLVVEEQTQHPAQVNSDSANKPSDPPFGDGVKDISLPNEPGEMSDAVTGPVEDQTQSALAQVNADSLNKVLDPPSGDVAKTVSSDCSEGRSKSLARSRSRHMGKSNSKPPKKYILRSLGSSDRALRSRDNKPKAPEPINNVVDVNNDETNTKKEKKKKKKARKEGINDQFSKIRAQLRYYLNRMGYEQNLIDAYSGEGWKGGSLEKLKPEKEIQRAKSEILRRKLKIRDLFQNLDSLCAEGKLPESLFDSEGEIDSEDIFCAKCQTKVLGTNNDIILCDGACDRGYHQLCLDPPLLTEDIPPGDEGWLCPGCDCKDDCIDIVNDLLGTSLSLTDTWERVFPEAATAAGSILDNNLGLPSDDSDDDDYNPNGPEDVEVEGGESSSDESEYASASENLEETRHEDQYMGLPSEDSEDDDYDPDAPNLGGKATEESSNSDFTSDSEDLAATIKDNMSVEQVGDVTSASLDNVKNKGSKKQNRKKPSLADELSSLVEPDLDEEDMTPASGKRNVERLDYQKLYEEAYHSDTSEDEDWAATTTPSRKKKLTGKITPVSPNGSASNNSRRSTKRNTHQHKDKNTNNSPTKTLEGCTESGSRGKKRGSPHKKLGEAAVQRLYKSFKENQYPERATKESLAQEIGLTFHQVDKWFGNSRWSFRHSPHMKASPGSNASQQATDSEAEKKGEMGNASQQVTDNGAENKGEKEHELVSQKTIGEKSRIPSSKKRKQQATDSGAEKKGKMGDASQQVTNNGAENKGEKKHELVSQKTIGEKSRTTSSKKRKQQATDSGAEKKGEMGDASQQVTDTGAKNKGEKKHKLVSQETIGEKSRILSSKKRKQQATDSAAEKKGEMGNASEQVTDNGAENKGEKESGLVSQKTIGEKSRTLRSRKRKQLSEPQASEAGLAPKDPTPPKVETGKKTKKKKGK
ncbi:homeobox protein HAT3.1 isoform X2 [Lathyrus oleraceus]|uniref:homeobox protein HAT3.1 isoform X2 n=1 Tax=Pisum sativum TaxID=3888 RepID=UPI0021D38ADC|nr:homeobox protein HAT3.1 isoform X2 [Pisum sativum]